MKALCARLPRVALLLAVGAVSPTGLFAQLDPPKDLAVVPRYGAGVRLVVSFVDHASGESGFEVQRRPVGGAFATVVNLGSSPGTGGIVRWVDPTATASQMWEYRVRATAAGASPAFTSASAATSPRQVWPIDNGDRDVLHSFGSPLDFSGNRYWHQGVDISAGGERVNAARGGRVSSTDALVGGQCWMAVDMDAAGVVSVGYAHVRVDATIGAGDFLAPGARIGTVRDNHFRKSREADHVHWGGSGAFNKLAFFQRSENRDPNRQKPVVADINRDGLDFIVVPADRNDHNAALTAAFRDVDFLVDAYDDMSVDTNLMSAPYRLGYYIEPDVPGGEAVASHTLLQFDFDLHPPQPAHAEENAAMYWDLPADVDGLNTWQTCLTWILTNARGNSGSLADLDANQFWRTDARKNTGARNNRSDAARAREIQETRFPDGSYKVHVVLDDLVHTTDTVRKVLVDNFRPYVRKLTVYSGRRVVYGAEWKWDSQTARLVLSPATLEAAAACLPAKRYVDLAIEVVFSEPMLGGIGPITTAPTISILPLGATVPLRSNDAFGNQITWIGHIDESLIADDGGDDGRQTINVRGLDLAGNSLLQIGSRSPRGADHNNRAADGTLRGAAGLDSVHGFEIGGSADLIVFARSPFRNYCAGSDIRFKGEVRNSGDAGSVKDVKVKLSVRNSAGSELTATTLNLGKMAASSTGTFDTTFPMPPPGTYTLAAEADPADEICEFNDVNNTADEAVNVLRAGVDLVPFNLRLTGSPCPGGLQQASFDLKNDGCGGTNEFDVQLAAGTKVFLTHRVPARSQAQWLTPSAEALHFGTIASGLLNQGVHQLCATVDTSNKVAERVESNNQICANPIIFTTDVCKKTAGHYDFTRLSMKRWHARLGRIPCKRIGLCQRIYCTREGGGICDGCLMSSASCEAMQLDRHPFQSTDMEEIVKPLLRIVAGIPPGANVTRELIEQAEDSLRALPSLDRGVRPEDLTETIALLHAYTTDRLNKEFLDRELEQGGPTQVDLGGGVRLTFSEVLESGSVAARVSVLGALGPLDALELEGRQAGLVPYRFELATSATVRGPIEVEIAYNEALYENEDSLRLLQLEEGAWVDRTSSLEPQENLIRATVDTLSPLLIVEEQPGAPAPNRASS